MKLQELFSSHPTSTYWLTRFVFLRLLGFVYFAAFLSLAVQVIPLLGHTGLLPVDTFLSHFPGSSMDNFIRLPSLFWFHISDSLLLSLAWVGVMLSLLVLLGFANVPVLVALWFLYMSFVHVGQLWYSYGWEIQLLETGFLAIFMVPWWDARPFPKIPVPTSIIWLLRWLSFRIYLGAGLIKLRGDPCWRDLTCLQYHYETQPIPNPLSRWLYFFPVWFHTLGVLWNHLVELIAPWLVFWPRAARLTAGMLMISFQFFLMVSGNLSFLNWLTILPVIACFDDQFLRKFLPTYLVKKAEYAAAHQQVSKTHKIVPWVIFILIAYLSIPVIQNLMSSHQVMNTSFNSFNLVNTYGAFGSVGKERYELILQGTDEGTLTPSTRWKEYEFIAKPGNITRSLPFIAPYQPRIDWQIWFAAMQRPEDNPWLIHLIWKLLHHDANTLTLIANNPFPDHPPTYIQVEFYRYEFVPPTDSSGAVWKRTYVGEWLPPLFVSTPGLKEFVKGNGWNGYEK